MEEITFSGRNALAFGRSKINLHEAGHSFQPYADKPTPGSADVCPILDGNLDDAIADLEAAGVPIEEGVDRTGATLVYPRNVWITVSDCGQVVRRCSWWSTTSAAATTRPMRHGQPRQRRSALKVVLSRELARSPRQRRAPWTAL
jgi:hypothetical protein